MRFSFCQSLRAYEHTCLKIKLKKNFSFTVEWLPQFNLHCFVRNDVPCPEENSCTRSRSFLIFNIYLPESVFLEEHWIPVRITPFPTTSAKTAISSEFISQKVFLCLTLEGSKEACAVFGKHAVENAFMLEISLRQRVIGNPADVPLNLAQFRHPTLYAHPVGQTWDIWSWRCVHRRVENVIHEILRLWKEIQCLCKQEGYNILHCECIGQSFSSSRRHSLTLLECYLSFDGILLASLSQRSKTHTSKSLNA